MARKNIALYLVFLLPVLTGLACTLPGMEQFFGNQVPSTPTTAACPEVVCPTCQPLYEVVGMGVEETATPTAWVTEVPTAVPPTAAPEPVWVYTLQAGSPVYLQNVHHPEKGERWMSLGGQIFGADGQPVEYVVVRVMGTVNGESVELLGMSGAADWYGPGGFEILLSETAFPSTGNFVVTLHDLEMNQLSERYALVTFEDAQRVTTIMNFVAVGAK